MGWVEAVTRRRYAWARELQDGLGPDLCARARRTVARMALNPQEEQDLLAALGLLEDVSDDREE